MFSVPANLKHSCKRPHALTADLRGPVHHEIRHGRGELPGRVTVRALQAAPADAERPRGEERESEPGKIPVRAGKGTRAP